MVVEVGKAEKKAEKGQAPGYALSPRKINSLFSLMSWHHLRPLALGVKGKV